VGAGGAGAAGSEIQPYLEGGIEEAALSGGRRGGGLLADAGAANGDAGSGDPAYRGAGWALGRYAQADVAACSLRIRRLASQTVCAGRTPANGEFCRRRCPSSVSAQRIWQIASTGRSKIVDHSA